MPELFQGVQDVPSGTGKKLFARRKFEEAEHEAKSLYSSRAYRMCLQAPISEVYASEKQNRGQIAGEESPKI